MPGRRLAHFHIEDRAGAEAFNPWILPKDSHREHDGLIEGISLDFGRVANAAHVDKRDGTRPGGHEKRV
jgi:hypothetical protein